MRTSTSVPWASSRYDRRRPDLALTPCAHCINVSVHWPAGEGSLGMERWQAELIGLGFYAVVAAWPAYRALTAGRPARVGAWAATATVAAAVAFLALPRNDSFVEPAEAVAAAVVAVAFAFGTRALAQRLLQRSQPLESPAALAADDAIRSSGVRAVVAAGTAMALLALSFACSALASTDVQMLRWTMGFVSVVTLGFSYGAWRTLVDPASWRVRREGPGAGTP